MPTYLYIHLRLVLYLAEQPTANGVRRRGSTAQAFAPHNSSTIRLLRQDRLHGGASQGAVIRFPRQAAAHTLRLAAERLPHQRAHDELAARSDLEAWQHVDGHILQRFVPELQTVRRQHWSAQVPLAFPSVADGEAVLLPKAGAWTTSSLRSWRTSSSPPA